MGNPSPCFVLFCPKGITMKRSALLCLAASLLGLGCDGEPVPRVMTFNPLTHDLPVGITKYIRAFVDPEETFVLNVEITAGKRPSLEHAVFIQGPIVLDPGSAGPQGSETVQPFQIRGDVPSTSEMEEGGVVDYHVSVTYRRPGETESHTFTTSRKFFLIGPPQGSRIQLEPGNTVFILDGTSQSHTSLRVRLIGDHAMPYDVLLGFDHYGKFEITDSDGEVVHTIRFGPEEHFRELTLTALELTDGGEEVRLYAQAPGWIRDDEFLTIVQ